MEQLFELFQKHTDRVNIVAIVNVYVPILKKQSLKLILIITIELKKEISHRHRCSQSVVVEKAIFVKALVL